MTALVVGDATAIGGSTVTAVLFVNLWIETPILLHRHARHRLPDDRIRRNEQPRVRSVVRVGLKNLGRGLRQRSSEVTEPHRLGSEAKFARLCGVAPIPTGSGQTDGHHRLHRGGDRQANSALWRIVITRMANDPNTQAYVERRTKEGKQTKYIMRCLKRYVARELFQLLPHQKLALTT